MHVFFSVSINLLRTADKTGFPADKSNMGYECDVALVEYDARGQTFQGSNALAAPFA